MLRLWPEGVPDARAGGDGESLEQGRVRNVREPSLTLHRPAPALAAGTALIVCPGGGYTHLTIEREGTEVARRLTAAGVTVFVLKYRLAPDRHPAPLRDLLRAIRLVRSRAGELGVRPDRVGVLGFSAGGHLAAIAGVLHDAPEGSTGAPLDVVAARPDFLALLYPVVTMTGPSAHAGSRRALLGESPDPALAERLSVETQVTRAFPPTFLVHTAEDTAVPLENNLLLFQALRAAGAPAELHLLEKGRHGFALDPDLGPASSWPGRLFDWMRAHGWLLPAR